MNYEKKHSPDNRLHENKKIEQNKLLLQKIDEECGDIGQTLRAINNNPDQFEITARERVDALKRWVGKALGVLAIIGSIAMVPELKPYVTQGKVPENINELMLIISLVTSSLAAIAGKFGIESTIESVRT